MVIDSDVKAEAFGMRFIWSLKKYHLAKKDHDVSFADILEVFVDQNAIETESKDIEGANLALIGQSGIGTIFIAYCYRNGDEVIRLVSARKADASQVEAYQKNVLKNLGISIPRSRKKR